MLGVFIRHAQGDASRQPGSVQVGQHPVMGAQQFRRRHEQTLAQRGEGHRLIVPVEQAPASDRFQALNMHADRRRAFVQLFCRRTEFADPRHRMKGTYQVDIKYGCHDSIFVND